LIVNSTDVESGVSLEECYVRVSNLSQATYGDFFLPLPLTVIGVSDVARAASGSTGEGAANVVEAAAKMAATAVKDFMMKDDSKRY
jgi:hypothetical protein